MRLIKRNTYKQNGTLIINKKEMEHSSTNEIGRLQRNGTLILKGTLIKNGILKRNTHQNANGTFIRMEY